MSSLVIFPFIALKLNSSKKKNKQKNIFTCLKQVTVISDMVTLSSAGLNSFVPLFQASFFFFFFSDNN